MARLLYDLHGGVVDEHELGFDRRVFGCQTLCGLAPQTRRCQYVGLVDDGELTAAFGRIFESETTYTLDFGARVDTCVVCRESILRTALRTSEIETSRQFPHAEEVGSLNKIGTQRRAVQQRGKCGDGAQVGIQTQLLAHGQQSLLGPHLGVGGVVEARVADGAEEYGIGLHTCVVRSLGVGVAYGIYGGGADNRVCILRLVCEACGYGIYGLDGLCHDFGAYAVTRKHGYLDLFHLCLSFFVFGSILRIFFQSIPALYRGAFGRRDYRCGPQWCVCSKSAIWSRMLTR